MKFKINNNSKTYKYLIIVLEVMIIIASCGVTIGSYFINKQAIIDQQKDTFNQKSNVIVSSIKERLINYEQILRGTKGLFASTPSVNANNWKNYINSLNIQDKYPGIQAVGYGPFIMDKDKNTILESTFTSSGSNLKITPDGVREFYNPVLFIEPETQRNLSVLGFDMTSESTRREAILSSKDSGDFAVTGKLTLYNDGNKDTQSGFIIYLPIFNNNDLGSNANTSSITSVTSLPNKDIKGVVYGAFKINDFLNGIFVNPINDEEMKIYINNESSDNLLYDNYPSNNTNTQFKYSTNLNVANKIWKIEFSSIPKYDQSIKYEDANNILYRGAIFTILLSVFFYVITTSRLNALKLVNKVTSQLQRTNAFQKAVINAANYAIISTDTNGIITSFNKGAVKLLGYRHKDVIGKYNIEKFYNKKELEESKKTLNEMGNIVESNFEVIIANTKFLLNNEREWLFKKLNQQYIPVYASTSVIKDDKEKVIGYMVIAEDVTERKKTEEAIKILNTQLQRSNDELQDFASIASHDLQEPLRKIQAFGDRLKIKYSDILPEDGKDYIYRMQNAANRMQTLINDLLTYSRVTTKAKPFENVNLSQILEEVLSDLEIAIQTENAVIEKDNLPSIEADPLQMRQLFQNLIGNAIKFHKMDTPPHICIKSSIINKEINREFVRITIEDNGIGFDEKYIDKIFTIFQRLNNSTEYKGSGVGLAICRKIVVRHQGTITAKSIINEGTTFIIELPIKNIINNESERQ